MQDPGACAASHEASCNSSCRQRHYISDPRREAPRGKAARRDQSGSIRSSSHQFLELIASNKEGQVWVDAQERRFKLHWTDMGSQRLKLRLCNTRWCRWELDTLKRNHFPCSDAQPSSIPGLETNHCPAALSKNSCLGNLLVKTASLSHHAHDTYPALVGSNMFECFSKVGMQETLGLKTILAIIYLVTRLYSAARRWHSRLCRATEWPEVSLDGPAWIKHDPTYAAMSEKVKLQGCLDPVPNILRALSGPRRRNCVNLVCEYFCWTLGDPHFFFGRSLPFLTLSIILKNKKICAWEVSIISHIRFKKGRIGTWIQVCVT